MTGMSYFLAISYTAFRLAMETGCPPAELQVMVLTM